MGHKVLRRFTCDLTGDKLMIVDMHGEEVCVHDFGHEEEEKVVWEVRWCDFCETETEFSSDNPWGTCLCS